MSPGGSDRDQVFRFLGRTVRIRSAHREFLRRIGGIFAPFRVDPGRERPVATYQVTGRGPFRLVRGGEPLYESDKLHYVVEFLETDLLQLLIQDLSDHLLVHGGAVATGDRVVLMPARAGSGKTTLAAALVRERFSFATDEMAALALDDSHLWPFPKALNLKSPSVALLSPFGEALQPIVPDDPVDGDRVHHTAVAPDRVLSPDDAFRVDRVVFPRYLAGAEDRIEAVPRARAIAEIAQLSFNHYRIPDRSLECLERLVGGAECYRLTYSHLDAAIGLVRSVLDERLAATAAGA